MATETAPQDTPQDSTAEQSSEVDAAIREALARVFRTHTSSVNPEHLAFVAERVVRDLMAKAWDEGVEHLYDGPLLGYMRLIEHNPYRGHDGSSQ